MNRNRVVWLWPAGIVFAILLGLSIAAQGQITSIELKPGYPTDKDDIAFTLSGVWRNGCVPQSPKVSISSGAIRIDTSSSGVVCTQALTPWSLSGTFGVLAPGDYLLTATYSAPGLSQPVEIGRKAFTVTGLSTANELIL